MVVLQIALFSIINFETEQNIFFGLLKYIASALSVIER